MWFGLIPGPYRVVRAFTPRRTRRHTPQRRRDNSTLSTKFLQGSIAIGMFGLLFVGTPTNAVQPGEIPPGVNAPNGWYTDDDGYLEPITGANVPPVIYPKAKDSSTPLGAGLLITAGIGLLLAVALRERATTGNHPTGGPGEPPHLERIPAVPPDLPTGPLSGHKPLNRELPRDRPHPWRTYPGKPFDLGND